MIHLRPLAVGAILGLLLAAPAMAQDPTGVSSEIERTASTTPQEKLAYAQSSNQEIREAEKQIARLLEQARRDSDAEAVQCLISRLTSVRALLQVSEYAEVAMRDAITSGEEERANHEFRKIAVAVSKTRILVSEAQRCASDQALDSGQTLVDWESRLGGEDGGSDDISDITIPIDPPQVSPFL